jgi:hypothetical protein
MCLNYSWIPLSAIKRNDDESKTCYIVEDSINILVSQRKAILKETNPHLHID